MDTFSFFCPGLWDASEAWDLSGPPAGGRITLPSPGSFLNSCHFCRKKTKAAEMGEKRRSQEVRSRGPYPLVRGAQEGGKGSRVLGRKIYPAGLQVATCE